MMCERPYVRMKTGVTRLDLITKEDARLAVTPFGCGKCIPCRINKARIWTHRILVECMAYEHNTFLTLTYSEDQIPWDQSVHKSELQGFMKRLRNYVYPAKIRYFGVGEYGEKTMRPHYHIILFGIGMGNEKLYVQAWNNYGYIHVGDVTPQSARYCTNYVMKGWNRDHKKLEGRKPEFMLCSRRPGIGHDVMKKIGENFKRKGEHLKHDIREMRVDGKKFPLGRYMKDKFDQSAGIGKDVTCMKLYDYQEELIEKHFDSEDYYQSILDEDKDKRHAIKKRIKIRRTKKL